MKKFLTIIFIAGLFVTVSAQDVTDTVQVEKPKMRKNELKVALLLLACGNSNKSNYHHGFIGLNADSPTAFTAGFRVGVAF